MASPSRPSSLGALSALALVVGLAASLQSAAPPHTAPLHGVWEHRDSTQLIRLGLWPGVALWGRDEKYGMTGFEGMEQHVYGVMTVNDHELSVRWYRWNGELGDYILAPPERMRWVAGRNGTVLLFSPERSLRLMRRSLGPSPQRVTVTDGSCGFGGCERWSVDVDSGGHVEYEREVFYGDRDSTDLPLGRYTSKESTTLFQALARVAAFSRPDSAVYRCALADAGHLRVTIDYGSGERVSQSARGSCGAFDFFSSEVRRLLPTLALAPTMLPHRFATDDPAEPSFFPSTPL